MIYTYCINQLRDIDEAAKLRFLDYAKTKELGEIKENLYFTADDGTIEADNEIEACEELFYIYNVCPPQVYIGRSMCTSDIVELWDNSGEAPVRTIWFCDRIGFCQILKV